MSDEVIAGNISWRLAEAEAEIGRLCVSFQRLKALSHNNAHSWDSIVRERDKLRAEVEHLREELGLIESDTGPRLIPWPPY